MLYERIADDIKRKEAATRIARRNQELVAGAAAAGAVASWHSISTGFPALGPVFPAAVSGLLGLVLVGGALLMRRRPPAALVDAIAGKLPKTGRRMLSRPAVVGISVLSLLFAWYLGQALVPAPPAQPRPAMIWPKPGTSSDEAPRMNEAFTRPSLS